MPLKIDATYVISLPEREDRRIETDKILKECGIDYKVYSATKMDNGAEGIKYSLKNLLECCLEFGMENILVFEDDVSVIFPVGEFKLLIDLCTSQLPSKYDMLYLGVNHFTKFSAVYGSNLLRVYNGYGLHSVIYSKRGMTKVLNMEDKGEPIDVQIRNQIQPDGLCFAAFPILCSQRPSFSNIENKNVDYSIYIEGRFKKNTKHLL